MHATRPSGQRLAWAVLFLAPALLQAQTIYRCGNSYSQTPCTGAVVVHADDKRTPDQKAQTDAATMRAARLAQRMERDRLAGAHSAKPVSGAPGASRSGKQQQRVTVGTPSDRASSPKAKRSKREQDPGYFIAAARQEEKKKTATAPSRD